VTDKPYLEVIAVLPMTSLTEKEEQLADELLATSGTIFRGSG